MVTKRNVVTIYILSILTFGIYTLYWLVKTKEALNSLGADIPTSWLLIVPIANIYWAYKFCEGYSNNVKKDNNPILWFIVYLLVGIIMPAIVQVDLNKLADKKA